jgi:hypothetical protein
MTRFMLALLATEATTPTPEEERSGPRRRRRGKGRLLIISTTRLASALTENVSLTRRW